jgi:hypothetical protein
MQSHVEGWKQKHEVARQGYPAKGATSFGPYFRTKSQNSQVLRFRFQIPISSLSIRGQGLLSRWTLTR